MPAKLANQRDQVLAEAREDEARQQAEGLTTGMPWLPCQHQDAEGRGPQGSEPSIRFTHH